MIPILGCFVPDGPTDGSHEEQSLDHLKTQKVNRQSFKSLIPAPDSLKPAVAFQKLQESVKYWHHESITQRLRPSAVA